MIRNEPVPDELECDVLATDGATVHLRAIRPDDGERLVEFHRRLSPDSVYGRFFNVHPRLSAAEVEHFTHVDYRERLALVVEFADQLIAVARYDRIPDATVAEVALVVSDARQGQ